jgi:hypothetical protein
MRENRTSGSVRGGPGNRSSYRASSLAMNSIPYIFECSLLILAGIAGWIAVSKKKTATENTCLHHQSLTPAGKTAYRIMLIAVVMSLALATIRESAVHRRDHLSKKREARLLDRINKKANEVKTLQELNASVREIYEVSGMFIGNGRRYGLHSKYGTWIPLLWILRPALLV